MREVRMKSSKLLWLGGLGAVGWAGAALGQTYRDTLLTREYHRCIKEDSSNAGWGQCLEHEDDRQEGRLNQTYRMVMARLPAPRKAALLTSERTWVKARKRECDAAFR